MAETALKKGDGEKTTADKKGKLSAAGLDDKVLGPLRVDIDDDCSECFIGSGKDFMPRDRSSLWGTK